jgi:hypothetical protein
MYKKCKSATNCVHKRLTIKLSGTSLVTTYEVTFLSSMLVPVKSYLYCHMLWVWLETRSGLVIAFTALFGTCRLQVAVNHTIVPSVEILTNLLVTESNGWLSSVFPNCHRVSATATLDQLAAVSRLKTCPAYNKKKNLDTDRTENTVPHCCVLLQ